MAAKRNLRLRHITATRTIRRAAKDALIPMPVFVDLSSLGVAVGLIALLKCSDGDVVDLAIAGKDAEEAGNSDVVEFAVAGKDVGLVSKFCSLSAHPMEPKIVIMCAVA